MNLKKKKKKPDYLIKLDLQFENEVVWGIKNVSDKFFTFYLHHGEKIQWDKQPSEEIKEEKEVLTDEQISEKLDSLPEKEGESEKLEERIDTESITLPPYPTLEEEQQSKEEEVKEEEIVSSVETPEEPKQEEQEVNKMHQPLQEPVVDKRRRGWLSKEKQEEDVKPAPLDLLKMQTIQENLDTEQVFPEGSPLERDADADLESEEHEKMAKEKEKDSLEDKRLSIAYNIKDFPLAEPPLINELCEAHKIFFDYLSKLQETHTPTDFQTAYNIQDRIAYLIDNQTLLYKSLTKQLIKYLNRINEKLKNYYDEITLKQEDLRKLNAQISRFNEYDRKTRERLSFAEEDTQTLKVQAKTYQDQIESITNLQESTGT
ncbi:hypothetical protein [Mycoplasma suis]|uniref:Uncharacterized protein n=1 Tax=Mycoplasma suis (strain Illinois) TaxID=768700 RepID=F0QQ50_MYCSL|nr:hypothetical protein [Mycoplasma suis]ADX97620.1 hypothetical protein MSU_0076 [Mycoplasma suis str. Illinois]